MFADMTAMQALAAPEVADELRRNQKRCILLWLAGGASQLETWDPKPGAVTGGPFQSIQTSVPGIRISELMPKMARRLKDTAIIRSLNTRNADHSAAAKMMMRGRAGEASVNYPDLGAVLARELGLETSQVPDYVSFYFATEGRNMSPGHPGFLGARFGSMDLYTSMIPQNIRRAGISEQDHLERSDLRSFLSSGFERGRTSLAVDSHNQAYRRMRGIMASESLFDIGRETQRTRDAYGPTLFGQQALAARRLVEAGVPFVRVGRAWWDSHGQNFETHQEMVPELDHVMSTLLDDLEQRGLFKNTLGRDAVRIWPHAQHQRLNWAAIISPPPGVAACPAAASREARCMAAPTRPANRSSTAKSTPPGCLPPSIALWASIPARITTSALGRFR